MYKAGNDIGGTFTDTVFVDEETGELAVGKVLTTPDDPSAGAVGGLAEVLRDLGAEASAISHIIHGTTLVTNSIIERKGSKTALITTRGFRDALETRNEKRYDLYDPFFELPEPLVPRYLRREVTERMANDGTVLVPLDEGEVEQVTRELVEEGVEAVGVCFLHSYRNPAHERAAKEIIERVAPQLLVSLSVDVIPEVREYPRASTTVANAFTQPLMTRYVSRMVKRLNELDFKGGLHVMLSSGGITTADVAQRFPVRVLESGPAAGAIAASFFGELCGLDKVISFDMGGTTAKICFIEDGKPVVTTDFEVARVHRFKKGSGLPIKLPVIDMIEIGAGGGSIARAAMGLMKVGPQSSGAKPGPACYGLGGNEPTVTDADLLLGYLNPGYFLGGKMGLDEQSSRRAIEEKLAAPLGLEPTEAAWGIYQVVNENMANAARVYASEKGKDARDYSLIAFGGAGPAHAYYVAQKLGIKRIIVPFVAGVTSALGFLAAPFAFDMVRSYMSHLGKVDIARVNILLQEMEAEGAELLKGAGIQPELISVSRSCEMRYVGQAHEIEVPLPNGVLTDDDIKSIQESFDREYRRLFHRVNEGYTVECLNWRVVASGPKPQLNLKHFPRHEGDTLAQATKGSRAVYFPEFGGFHDCKVYDRYALFDGASFEGPAVVEDRESTTIVGPGAQVRLDQHLNLIIEITG